jgi:phosphate transport system protein
VRGDKQDWNLEQLQQEVMVLGGLAEAMLLEAADLLMRCDLDGLERIRDDERQIGLKRLAIEMGSLQFIANHRPKNDDLRTAVATIEIATELERIGEHAKRVARANSLTVEHHLRKPMTSIRRLAGQVQTVLNQTLEAFARRDLTLVRGALSNAQAADGLYRQIYEELLTAMSNRPRVVSQAIYLSRAAYNLKRAAERVSAICEWVIFVVEGTMEGTGAADDPLAEDDLRLQQAATAH